MAIIAVGRVQGIKSRVRTVRRLRFKRSTTGAKSRPIANSRPTETIVKRSAAGKGRTQPSLQDIGCMRVLRNKGAHPHIPHNWSVLCRYQGLSGWNQSRLPMFLRASFSFVKRRDTFMRRTEAIVSLQWMVFHYWLGPVILPSSN